MIRKRSYVIIVGKISGGREKEVVVAGMAMAAVKEPFGVAVEPNYDYNYNKHDDD